VLAGLVGLCTLILVGPGHLGWPSWPGPAVAVAVAVILPIYAMRRLMRRPRLVSPGGPPPWTTGLASVLAGIGVGLAVASFGIYSHVVELGHRL